jgi:hypothetical protein
MSPPAETLLDGFGQREQDGPVLLSPSDILHRAQFRTFATDKAEPYHQFVLSILYEEWDGWNSKYFNNELVVPYVMLTGPGNPQAYGECRAHSGFGGKCEIRIRPSLLTGSHPHVRPGKHFSPGRLRLVADVFLHEAVHQYHLEVTGQTEKAYKGHGPAFRDVCNRIGQDLGLPPVRIAKARGKEKDLPSCADWPYCVRPAGYYGGAYIPPGEQGEDGSDGESSDDERRRLVKEASGEPFRAARAYGRARSPEARDALLQAAVVLTQTEDKET